MAKKTTDQDLYFKDEPKHGKQVNQNGTCNPAAIPKEVPLWYSR